MEGPVKEIVLGQSAEPGLEPNPEVAAKAAFWAGWALAVPGWLDVLMLYANPQFANIEWEFGTVTSTFDAMPLGSIALMMIALGAVGSGRSKALKFMSVVFGLLSLSLILLLVVFALDLPVIIPAIRPDMATSVKQSLIKTALSATAYVALYLAMTVYCWKRSKPASL